MIQIFSKSIKILKASLKANSFCKVISLRSFKVWICVFDTVSTPLTTSFYFLLIIVYKYQLSRGLWTITTSKFCLSFFDFINQHFLQKIFYYLLKTMKLYQSKVLSIYLKNISDWVNNWKTFSLIYKENKKYLFFNYYWYNDDKRIIPSSSYFRKNFRPNLFTIFFLMNHDHHIHEELSIYRQCLVYILNS